MCWIERVYFQVLQTEASRLLKMDLLMTLVELRRQDECALAIQVTQTLCVPLSSCSQILIFQGKFSHFWGYFVVYVNHPQHSAVQIFEMVRKEPWYKPDRFLYREMMDTLGRNQLIEVFFAKKSAYVSYSECLREQHLHQKNLTSSSFVSCFFILWGWGFLGSRATIQGSSR
jgi:hypothetical protein